MTDLLKKREIHGGQVMGSNESGNRLVNPQNSEKTYTLAQLDDYMHLSRGKFPHTPPLRIRLEARVIGNDLRGTFGFGLWNDPFSFGFGPAGVSKLLPVLPNAAWFFYASPRNYLSLRDDQPGSGFHVKTFRSPLIPSVFSLLAVSLLPFFFIRPTARFMRRFLRTFIKEDTKAIGVSIDQWHTYSLLWQENLVAFEVDGSLVFKTALSPKGKLGLVIWIDNQFFRFDPEGYLTMGYLETHSEQALEIRQLALSSLGGMIIP